VREVDRIAVTMELCRSLRPEYDLVERMETGRWRVVGMTCDDRLSTPSVNRELRLDARGYENIHYISWLRKKPSSKITARIPLALPLSDV
jgi:hypothetical protein